MKVAKVVRAPSRFATAASSKTSGERHDPPQTDSLAVPPQARLQTLLTTAGVVLGVAVFVGIHTANQSVLFAFSRTIDRIPGRPSYRSRLVRQVSRSVLEKYNR